MGCDPEFFFHRPGVDIGGVFEDGQVIHFGDPFGELIEDRGIGFQVDAAAGYEDLLIEPDEFGMGQARRVARDLRNWGSGKVSQISATSFLLKYAGSLSIWVRRKAAFGTLSSRHCFAPI